MGTIWVSAFTHLNRPFPGAKLDVPRLAAPRGAARGRVRANRPGLPYHMFESHSCYGTRSPVSKSELQMQLSVFNCMYISMSYFTLSTSFLARIQ